MLTLVAWTAMKKNVCLLCILLLAASVRGEEVKTPEMAGVLAEPPRLLCEPGDVPPPSRVDTAIRVAQLRTLMLAANVSAYIVLTNDDHQSEYVAPRDERRRFISGFSGSSGWAAVTTTDAALWTDSRYFLQSDQQLDCAWKLMRDGEPGVPSMEAWLSAQLQTGSVVSADTRTVPHTQWLEWSKYFESTGILLQETDGDNLVDEVWGAARPPYPTDAAFALNESLYTGVTWREKARTVATKVREAGANVLVVCALDDVAWLLNVRADDIPFTPVVRAYITLELQGTGGAQEDVPLISLYVAASKITPALEQHLGAGSADAVKISEYESFWSDLEALGSRMDTLLLLPQTFSYNLGASHAVHSKLPAEKVKLAVAPIAVMKDVKNPTEARGMRSAHVRDAAALVTFLAKLEAGVKAGEQWDELKASREVDRLRGLQALNRGPSFDSISASGANAALPHYEPSEATNTAVNDSAIYLLDSGGQYLDGTTDVTRTVHMGAPTPEHRDVYTRLLAGCATLASATFPLGTTTAQLDILLRGALYSQGLDYGHGSTHGIGVFLGVHEAFNTTLNENFFGSHEPGFYVDGDYGMRLENIVTVVKANVTSRPAGKTYLTFETVTLVPYEPNLIDVSLLNREQVAWVNAYHVQVQAEVRPLLVQQGSAQAISWLDARTKPLVAACRN